MEMVITRRTIQCRMLMIRMKVSFYVILFLFLHLLLVYGKLHPLVRIFLIWFCMLILLSILPSKLYMHTKHEYQTGGQVVNVIVIE